MTYNYTQYQVELGTLMALTSANPGLPPTDPYFQQILPACIDYAENRIYRELDIQSTTTNGTLSVTSGTPFVTLPETPIVYVVESLFVSQLANGSAPPIGTSTMLTPVDKGFLMSTYPPAYWPTAQGQPQFYYVQDQQTVQLGPCPDQNYVLEMTYTYRPVPLSASNVTTILTQIWPELFLAASMVFMSAYQKNFGSQADDPKMAQSWENQYQLLLASAKEEESRKKNLGVQYTPLRKAAFADGGGAPKS
jgi:hypothetical protein